jgi:hypothetical protein
VGLRLVRSVGVGGELHYVADGHRWIDGPFETREQAAERLRWIRDDRARRGRADAEAYRRAVRWMDR